MGNKLMKWNVVASLLISVGLLLILAVCLVPLHSQAADLSRPPLYTINSDPYGDLVIGVPGENLVDSGVVTDAGVIHLLFGTEVMLSPYNNQLWSQSMTGSLSSPEALDEFGRALAVGDFNGDNYVDLAVGIPGETLGTADQAGAVQIFYGEEDPVGSDPTIGWWHQGVSGIDGDFEDGDRFGRAVIAGDFNGDGYDDLAIGVPYEDLGATADAGCVHVLYGSAAGISATGSQLWTQDSPGISVGAEGLDAFGFALAAGDFNDDGYDDLAIGVPGEEVNGDGFAGAVNVIFGTSAGLDGMLPTSLYVHQDWSSLEGEAAALERFGHALTVGDFNGDGYDDLAVGVIGQEVGGDSNAGAVHILFGATYFDVFDVNEVWDQDDVMATAAEADDLFGYALAVGDFDGDGYDDLAVGVPFEDYLLANEDVGCVNVLYGSAAGMTVAHTSFYWQGVDGIADTREEYDSFGWAMAAGHLDGDSYADLAIGAPFEDVGAGIADAGVVHTLYGDGSDPLGGSTDQLWTQGDLGLLETAEPGDQFGYALVVMPNIPWSIYLPILLRLA